MITDRNHAPLADSRTSRVALAVAGLAALLASACCLGPLLLLVLGVTGAWIGNLSALEQYRPLFISASLVALFFAHRRIRRAADSCPPGGVCEASTVRTAYKVAFWIVVALLALAVVFPLIAPLFY
jgi:mercuric ion transport protein